METNHRQLQAARLNRYSDARPRAPNPDIDARRPPGNVRQASLARCRRADEIGKWCRLPILLNPADDGDRQGFGHWWIDRLVGKYNPDWRNYYIFSFDALSSKRTGGLRQKNNRPHRDGSFAVGDILLGATSPSTSARIHSNVASDHLCPLQRAGW